jgi:two-component system nitrate/nitrite response regulator NarL
MKIKILLVDDHPMLLGGLRQVIALQPHLTLVGEAFTGALGRKLANELAPDVVVMDVHLPDMTGIAVTRQILAAQPSLKITSASTSWSPCLSGCSNPERKCKSPTPAPASCAR